jgi:hypothetical protein
MIEHRRVAPICIAVVMLLHSGCGRQEGEPNTRPAMPPKPGGSNDRGIVSMTSMDFAEEYEKDPKGSNAKYKGKTIELSGVIASVSQAAMHRTVFLEGGKETLTVEGVTITTTKIGPQCLMVDPAPWRKHPPGQRVKLRGMCLGGSPPTLDRCTVVEVGETRTPKLTAEEIAREYTADYTAATRKYHNKHLILRGVVVAKRVNIDGVIVELRGDGKKKVECNYDVSDFGASVAVGDTVSLFGMLWLDGDGLWIRQCYPTDWD